MPPAPRHAGAPSRSAGSKNTTNTRNATTMRPWPATAPARHGDDHHANAMASPTAASRVRSRKRIAGAPLSSTCRLTGCGHRPRIEAGRAGGELQQGGRPAFVRNRLRRVFLHIARSRVPGCGPPVSTWLADGLPQPPSPLDTTCRSACLPRRRTRSGMALDVDVLPAGPQPHAPAITATPIAASSPTMILAGNGSTGDGPDGSVCEWEWSPATR